MVQPSQQTACLCTEAEIVGPKVELAVLCWETPQSLVQQEKRKLLPFFCCNSESPSAQMATCFSKGGVEWGTPLDSNYKIRVLVGLNAVGSQVAHWERFTASCLQ